MEKDVITIDEVNHRVMLQDKLAKTPFLSFRWRPDMRWGFECKCSNYTLLAEGEREGWRDLVLADPVTLKKLAKILSKPVTETFEMAVI